MTEKQRLKIYKERRKMLDELIKELESSINYKELKKLDVRKKKSE